MSVQHSYALDNALLILEILGLRKTSEIELAIIGCIGS